jgi:hypothetical protein
MGPTRKSRSVNKRFSNIREAAASKDKDAANTGKNRQKASPGIQKVNLFLNLFETKFFLYTCIQNMGNKVSIFKFFLAYLSMLLQSSGKEFIIVLFC